MGAENSKPRYLYIDNLRLVMIILVVLLHLGVTYSGIGSWYLTDVKELDTLCYVVFGLFQSYTQAYFMGFLFLISFGVYVFHAPVVILVSEILLPLEMYPLVKFLLAAILGLPLSFLLSHYVFRKIPYLKRVL